MACWFNEPQGIEICEQILGAGFDPNQHSTDGQESCWVGIFDSDEDGLSTNCIGCDIGCRPCLDDPTVMRGWADKSDGEAYLRPDRANAPFRDARGAIADITAGPLVPLSRPRHQLMLEEINLERSPCNENTQPRACWDARNHPCFCMDTFGDCGPGTLGVPVLGELRDRWFFLRTKWPVSTDDGTMFCRNFLDGDQQTNVKVRARRNQTRIIGVGFLAPCASDLLVRCSGCVPGSSDCSNEFGECSPVRPLVDPGFCPSYVGGAEENQFDRIFVKEFTPTLRKFDWMTFDQKTEIDFKNGVLESVGNTQFGAINFEQLDHRVTTVGNSGLGDFDRTFSAANLAEGIPIMVLPAKTRWGGCEVFAEVRIVGVEFLTNVMLHSTRNSKPFQGPVTTFTVYDHYVTPFVTIQINITLGVRAVLMEACVVNGQPQTITTVDNWPTIGPDGNRIIYDFPPLPGRPVLGPRPRPRTRPRSILIPRRIEWRGMLNYHTDPPVEPILVKPFDAPEFGLDCGVQAAAIGEFTVPGVPGAFDTDPDDRNNAYGGSIKMSFV